MFYSGSEHERFFFCVFFVNSLLFFVFGFIFVVKSLLSILFVLL